MPSRVPPRFLPPANALQPTCLQTMRLLDRGGAMEEGPLIVAAHVFYVAVVEQLLEKMRQCAGFTAERDALLGGHPQPDLGLGRALTGAESGARALGGVRVPAASDSAGRGGRSLALVRVCSAARNAEALLRSLHVHVSSPRWHEDPPLGSHQAASPSLMLPWRVMPSSWLDAPQQRRAANVPVRVAGVSGLEVAGCCALVTAACPRQRASQRDREITR